MNSQREMLQTRVLIVGAGAAGLRTAIELTTHGVNCLVIGKRAHGDAHTRWAAGGINAAIGTRDPDDSWQRHFADTLREGHFVCDPIAVELLCRDAPDRVHELREWGCAFSETDDGRIDQRYFGAQSYRRTCFVGDRTGEAILATLVERCRHVGVQWRQDVYIAQLLRTGGRVTGALGFDIETGTTLLFSADAVVIAAGGATSAYRRSSSRPDENNGDAASLAWNAGAALRDMEFVQFHPTGMVKPPELRGRLVTEAVRGEGGRLFNASGERFMERYSPERLELDARDVVARAIYREIREGRGTDHDAVLLDVSHRDADYIRERLPKVVQRFAELDIDVTRDAVHVAPTAHYSMGGVRVDFETGATDVAGLFVVGEATAGVHGANRLGGNSLAETLVFGRRTGVHLAREIGRSGAPAPDPAQVEAGILALEQLAGARGRRAAADLVEELGTLLWEHAGIVRSGEELIAGTARLEEIRRSADDVACDGPASESFRAALDLRSMLCVAEVTLRCALLREESRGAHYRSDHPDTEPDWQRTILCGRGADDTMHTWTVPVPPVPEQLRATVAEEVEPDYHHLE
jgi:succinate dehydrogenase / fumarate reductase, flavoprotein subunit